MCSLYGCYSVYGKLIPIGMNVVFGQKHLGHLLLAVRSCKGYDMLQNTYM